MRRRRAGSRSEGLAAAVRALCPHLVRAPFHPIYKEWRFHSGQDVASLPSAGPVVAAAEGTVISAHREPIYGNIFSLRHGNGVVIRHGHLASIDPKSSSGLASGSGSRSVLKAPPEPAPDCICTSSRRSASGAPVNPVWFMADRGAPLNGKTVGPSRKAVPLVSRPHRAGSAGMHGIVHRVVVPPRARPGKGRMARRVGTSGRTPCPFPVASIRKQSHVRARYAARATGDQPCAPTRSIKTGSIKRCRARSSWPPERHPSTTASRGLVS
jgi:hypothetical protein